MRLALSHAKTKSEEAAKAEVAAKAALASAEAALAEALLPHKNVLTNAAQQKPKLCSQEEALGADRSTVIRQLGEAGMATTWDDAALAGIAKQHATNATQMGELAGASSNRQEQIDALRPAMRKMHLWGTAMAGVMIVIAVLVIWLAGWFSGESKTVHSNRSSAPQPQNEIVAKSDVDDKNLADKYRNGVGVEPDQYKAFELYEKLANNGDLDAMVELADYYEQEYGVQPIFKAGLHLGPVTVVEVGNLKREIAYHGDTINVAARIQEQCKTFDRTLLISDDAHKRINDMPNYSFENVGEFLLRGRKKSIQLFGVARQ